jgi:DNA modification methylase
MREGFISKIDNEKRSYLDSRRRVVELTESELHSTVVKALDDAATIGLAPRQIALKTGVSKEEIIEALKQLAKDRAATKIGRNLWILSRNLQIGSDANFKDAGYYAKKFESDFRIKITRRTSRITFTENGGKRVQRWSPYVQGFSSSFVNNIFKKYNVKKGSLIADQFVGSGTVAVCAKMHGINCIGIDAHPLMAFMAKNKLTWDVGIEDLFARAIDVVSKAKEMPVPAELPFLTETRNQFEKPILENLLKLRAALPEKKDSKISSMLWFAFGSILVDSSRLWHAPGLGYTKKNLTNNAPFLFFMRKIADIVDDLHYVQQFRDEWGDAKIVNADSRKYEFERNSIDMAVTSPPYTNGIDYVINYKIEAAWLNVANSYEDLARIRDKNMVVCDNTSRGAIEQFADSSYLVHDEWLENIVSRIGSNLAKKEISRRPDTHLVVRKYFEDIYPALVNIHDGLKKGGRIVMVLGDSLISGAYIPADMIIARMGKQMGFEIESLEIARQRRSGQRRDFLLRESILVLTKTKSDAVKPIEKFGTN